MAHRHEVIVVGAGGAGLTAALYAAKAQGRNRVAWAGDRVTDELVLKA